MRPILMFAYAFCACLVLAVPVRAQETDYAPASSAHRPGRWSMQFQIVDDFRLSAFGTAGLAMTRNAGTNSAWRFGVTLSGQSVGGHQARTIRTDSTSAEDDRPLDRDSYSVRLDVLHVRRFHPARRVGLELGVGPSVDFLRIRDKSEFSNPPYSDQSEVRFSTSSYGLAGRLGVEVFLARALSVHAHYGATAGYMQDTETGHSTFSYAGGSSGESRYDSQRRRWFLQSEGVGMGISVYL